MIVLILVLIWLVVLAPSILHRLTSSNVFSSIIRFHAGTRLLQKILGHREDAIPVFSGLSAKQGLSHREQALRNAEIIRKRRERQRTLKRRRRSVLTLFAGLFGTLAIGAIPRLHLLWAFSGLTAMALVAYLSLLAHFTRLEVNAAERRVKVVPMPQTILPVAMNADGSYGISVQADREASYRVAYAVTGSH